MAKDSKVIIGSVRLDKVYLAGMEDELEKVLKLADVERLTDKGVIAGFEVKEVEDEVIPSAVELGKLSKPKLLTLAAKWDIEIADGATNKEIVATIVAANEGEQGQ